MFGELSHRMPSLLRMGNQLVVPTWGNTLLDSALYSSTASGTANSNATTSLIGSGIGSLTLPPNFFQAGTTIAIEAIGSMTSAASPSTFIFQVSLGVSTIANTNNGSVLTPTASMSPAQPFTLFMKMTCQSSGAAGKVMAVGVLTLTNSTSNSGTAANTVSLLMCNGASPGTLTVNTQIAQAIAFSVTQATNTASTITCTNFNVYQIY